MTLSPRRFISIWFCQPLDFADVWSSLLWILSNWVFVYFDFFHLGVWPLAIIPTYDCIHYWFCQHWILLKIGSVNFGLCSWSSFSIWDHVHLAIFPTGCLSTWNLSTWVSGHMTFFSCRIVSSIGSINSGLCSFLVLFTWESVHLGLYLLWFCQLGSLSTWHSAHVGLCPQLVLSNLFSTHVWFDLLGIMFIKDFFYLRSCPLCILFTWMFVYLYSVFSGAWPHDLLPT